MREYVWAPNVTIFLFTTSFHFGSDDISLGDHYHVTVEIKTVSERWTSARDSRD
jgi:hypothetical protein